MWAIRVVVAILCLTADFVLYNVLDVTNKFGYMEVHQEGMPFYSG